MDMKHNMVYTVKSILDSQPLYVTQNRVASITREVHILSKNVDMIIDMKVSNLRNVKSISLIANDVPIHDFLKDLEKKCIVFVCSPFTCFEIIAESTTGPVSYTLSWKNVILFNRDCHYGKVCDNDIIYSDGICGVLGERWVMKRRERYDRVLIDMFNSMKRKYKMLEFNLKKEISSFLSKNDYLYSGYESKKKYKGQFWQLMLLKKMFTKNTSKYTVIDPVRLVFPFLTNEINIEPNHDIFEYCKVTSSF